MRGAGTLSRVLFTVLLALTASVSYGVSDFAGAVAARRLRVIPATAATYSVALVTLAALLLVVPGAWSSGSVMWGAAAGIAAVVGFVAFYAALAAGPMSLAAPLIAVLGSLVPVLVAVALGESLPLLAWVAIGLAIVGAGLISVTRRAEAPRLRPRTVVLSVVAGASLGLSVVFLDRVPSDSGITAAVVEIAVGVGALGATLGLARVVPAVARAADSLDDAPPSSGTRGRALAISAVAGVLLGIANAALVVALLGGSLAVVSVLVGLYPAATILLARLVHGERIGPLQVVGVVVAIGASVLLALA